MPDVAASIKEGVRSLLQALGETVTLRRPGSGGTYDHATGTVVGGTDADELVRVAFLNAQTSEMDASDVVRTQRKALVSATYNGSPLTRVPRVGDELVGVEETVTIVSVQTIRPSGVVVGYTCLVKT